MKGDFVLVANGSSPLACHFGWAKLDTGMPNCYCFCVKQRRSKGGYTEGTEQTCDPCSAERQHLEHFKIELVLQCKESEICIGGA